MSWGARLQAALSGDVSGADVSSMLAATAPLMDLSRALADRRLSAELDHAGHEWRVCMTLAPMAAPLWLGEALVTIAQSFVEAEAAGHPDRPYDLSPLAHALAVLLLQPVETTIAEVSAALVDPNRPTGLTAPLTVGPRGVIAAYLIPDPVPLPYARGLLLSATRVQGAAQVALDDTTALVGRSPAPDWLTAALRRVGGELRAARARLDADEIRLTPLLRAPRADYNTLPALCAELWDVLNTALVTGQMLREPHLLPGAPTPHAPTPDVPAPPSRPVVREQWAPISPAPVTQRPAIAATPSQRPPTPPKAERPVVLPSVGDGVREAPAPLPTPARREPDQAITPASAPHPHDEAPALPMIGPSDASPTPASRHPRHEPPAQPTHDGGYGDSEEPRGFQLPRIGRDT
jgi:hypothetical protein